MSLTYDVASDYAYVKLMEVDFGFECGAGAVVVVFDLLSIPRKIDDEADSVSSRSGRRAGEQ